MSHKPRPVGWPWSLLCLSLLVSCGPLHLRSHGLSKGEGRKRQLPSLPGPSEAPTVYKEARSLGKQVLGTGRIRGE